ncbi:MULTISPECIES: helicase C-terminal domain-containing protein [Halolamina]|uniref:Rad3-related DNA helicase n=1 Tax=Halolamina pelagica TaxID=699431 RepID=A0A1I5QCM2_9EURY|nr:MULTISPECIES: ATP-dependent DNA helicase [Halolamina]NHX35203.1 ATP-dependent DNA helicase [Halolamina sp. R1-12]SFP44022.1 Rad3-related DNA helicase [Halolamina pelagica]
MEPARIPDSFPAPSHRGNQERALADIRDAFAAGNDVVLVRAPTGSGKSLLARSIMGAARTVDEADPAQPTGAYYTTPQVSQLDDVEADDLLEDFRVIRGKNNYDCILPGEHDTPVDQAPCVRKKGFDCTVRHRCPYFSDRAIASNQPIAAMTLAYFMQTAGSDVFRMRDVVVVDEAHGLAEWAEMYATVELSPRRVPIWDDVDVPDVTAATGDEVEGAVRFAEQLLERCEVEKDRLLAKPELTPEEAARRDRLQELISELAYFAEDYRDPNSPTTWVVDQPEGAGGAVSIKPLDPAKYLKHTVWDRGSKFALLSATILNKEAFCRGVGLDPENVALVEVGHTFPVENRPLYDATQGKMTYEHRDETLPKIADLVVRLMAKHADEKGLIHCHSYAIQEQLADRLADLGVAGRVRVHDRENRDAQLEAWKASDEPELFLSVKMEEALNLEGDLCRWQVLCKAPYLNTKDSRVERRLAEGQWAWYYRAALRTVIQACGRVVRSPEDYGATYLADDSLLELFDRASTDIPGWFQDQVDRLAEPTLRGADPSAALAGVDASPNARSSGRAGRSGSRGSAGSTTSSSSSSSGSSSTGSATSPGSDSPANKTEAEAEKRENHPLSDVWGDG